MKRMSIAREIRINRMQNKNRMTGQTFNPTGITSQQLQERELAYIQEVKAMTDDERKALYNQFKDMDKWKRENNYHFSNSWEHNAFMRNFGYKFS